MISFLKTLNSTCSFWVGQYLSISILPCAVTPLPENTVESNVNVLNSGNSLLVAGSTGQSEEQKTFNHLRSLRPPGRLGIGLGKPVLGGLGAAEVRLGREGQVRGSLTSAWASSLKQRNQRAPLLVPAVPHWRPRSRTRGARRVLKVPRTLPLEAGVGPAF